MALVIISARPPRAGWWHDRVRRSLLEALALAEKSPGRSGHGGRAKFVQHVNRLDLESLAPVQWANIMRLAHEYRVYLPADLRPSPEAVAALPSRKTRGERVVPGKARPARGKSPASGTVEDSRQMDLETWLYPLPDRVASTG
jgi:hypothetical protein